MKTTAKRLLAALLCSLMILSAFAVIPAVAEETTAAGDNTAEPEGGENAPEGEETETAESGTGFENLLKGEVITFDDWDPDAGEKAQHYVWRKSGFFLTNIRGNSLDSGSTLVSDGKGGYRMLLNGNGTYVNNAELTDDKASTVSLQIQDRADTKVDTSKALLDLFYGESGPTKYSLQMDFVISDGFIGTAASNDAKNNAVSGYRGFSLVDFGGGWIIKATAPGIAPVVTLETKTNADTGKTSYVKYNYDTNNNTYTANEKGAYYKITGTSTPEADAEKLKNVGYLYPVGAVSAYIFDETVKAGMSSNSTYMGKANVVTGEQVGTSSYYYVSGRVDAAISADYIKGAFSYTAGEPFTLRFDFERTAVSGANNDKVLVTVYGIREGQPDLLIGTKTYNTSEAVRDYGIRFSDNSTAKTQIDNIKLTIAEDAEYTCAGDHASLVSGCEITEIKNLPSFFEVRYSCGKVEHVEHMLADKVTDLTSGETLTVSNSFINGTGSDIKIPVGKIAMTFNFNTVKGVFDPNNSAYTNKVIIRLGGRNILNFGVVEKTVDEKTVKVGKLYTNDKSTASTAPAITDSGSAELMELEAGKTYKIKLETVPPVERNGAHGVNIYVDGKLLKTLSYTFASGLITLTGLRVSGKNHITITETRVYADNDFVIAAELNTRADYKKPAEDFELVKLGDATLLTLTKDGKVVTGSGDVMHESLTPMRTNPIFIRVLPSYGGFDVIYYKDNAEVGRGYVSVSADSYMSGLVFAAPEGLHINNIKAVTLKASTAYPTALSGVTSKKAEGYCVHRDPDGDVSTAQVSRSFVLVPSLNVNSSGETQGVNELWYYYDCYYCGERMYVNMGENLYNSTKAEYQAYGYKRKIDNDGVTDADKKTNNVFDSDGVHTFTNTNTFYVYNNQNIVESGGKDFWISFTYKFDTIKPGDIVAKGDGGSLFNIMANFSSMLRVFAVAPKDSAGNALTDSTDPAKAVIFNPSNKEGTAGTDYSTEYVLLRNNDNSKKYALVKAGDVLNFTFFIHPSDSTSTSVLWLNGEYSHTFKTFGNKNNSDDPKNTNPGYAFRFHERSTYCTGSLSNFAFVLDDRAEAPKHEHDTSGDDNVEILVTDDEVYQIVDCYCGARIKQGIVEIVKNKIENFYGGYGMVEYTNPGTHYVVTDIGLKADIESGALITLGGDVVLDASELEYTAPTTVTAAVRVKETSYELYIDNKSVKSGTLSAKPESVTFGAENVYDNSVSFKYNKIVKLGSTSFDRKVEFIDNPVGAVCYHEGSALKFTGNSYMNTAPIDGVTFEATNADGKANEVLGLKNIKARYICSVCGDSVYAAQGEALGVNVNLAHDDGKHFNTIPLNIDANGSSETTAAAHTITVPMEDICYGNKLWMSFDFTYSATAKGVETLMRRGTGGSVISLRVPIIQSKFLQSAHTDRFDYIQLVRGFAVIRPDVELDGNYTVNDYYDDRMGVWYEPTSGMVNQPESAYKMVFMNGQTYKVDICIESADDGITYSTYIDGKLLYSYKNTGIRHYFNIDRDDTIPEGFVRNPKKADESVYPVEDAETYAEKYSPAIRFCDDNFGNFKLSNLAMVKYGAGKDDYSGNTTVFEISATKPETAGTIASVGGVGLLSVDAGGKLIAADGNVLTKKVGEAYEDVVLGNTELYISAVLYDGAVRYYTGASRETLGYAYANGAVSAAINLTADDLKDTELEVGATVRVLDIYGSVGNAETEYITYQKHMTTPNKIRVVAANDVLYFGETGFRVRTERVVEDKTVVTETVKSSGTVFSSILAEGIEDKKITADRYGHRYFSLLELSELANGGKGEVYKMYITPFNVIEENGEAVYSAKTAVISVTVDDEAKCEQSVIDTAEVPQVTSAE